MENQSTSSNKTAREILESRGKIEPDVVAVKLKSKRGSEAIVDLMTPLPESEWQAGFDLVRKATPEGLEVIRHSTAHVMADAVQKLFPGTKVTFGPATDNGFYYDFDRPGGTFSEEDLEKIEAKMKEIIATKSPFRREKIERKDAIDLFSKMGETYKVEWMNTLPPDTEFSVYKHGAPGSEWVDFCKGPHVPNTEFLAAVKLTAVSGTYWRGDERNPQLQRIYGTAFHSEKALDAYLKQLEEAKARDHRKLGKELELFAFDGTAVASPFFLPRGAKIYNRMVEYIRDVYVRYGYEEIITPQIFSAELFKTSGHLANYAEGMYFAFAADDLQDEQKLAKLREAIIAPDKTEEQLELLAKEVRGVKPMNCPGHCQLFSHRKRSYRELPWRCADFGRLHRYERGGVVHGLARVRTFCQDDAHIFCAPHQIEQEIVSFCNLLDEVYTAFGFTDVRIKLAVRPGRGRGRVLRPETRVPRQGRHRPLVAARHHSGRPEPARALRSQVHRPGGQGADADHAPPRDPRLDRAVLRGVRRARRRQLPGVARARADLPAHREREGRRLREGSARVPQVARRPRRGRPLERQARGEDPQRPKLPLPLPGRHRSEGGRGPGARSPPWKRGFGPDLAGRGREPHCHRRGAPSRTGKEVSCAPHRVRSLSLAAR